MGDISSPGKTKIQKSSRKSGGVSVVLGGGSQLFSTPARTGTRNNQPSISAQNPPIPKMSVIFMNSNNIKVGSFGKLEFLDNQAAFTAVFRDKPTILAPNIDTPQYSTSTASILYSLEENCKLDVFLHMCRKYYARHDSIDNSLSVKYLCRQIS